MTKDELIHKLADLEWEDFEVKSAKAELPKNTWETVSAFSNTAGGWLLFGIQQQGRDFIVQGVENPEKIEQDFLNTIRSGKFNDFVPTKQAKYNIDGRTVIAFYVPVSKKKPIYYNSLSNTFIRRGSSDQRATKEEIDTMFRDQTFGTKTSEHAPDTTKANIHEKSLKQYRDYMGRFNPDVSYNRYDEDEFLHKLRILDNGCCTYGGLLFIGKRESIEKHFPDFRIDLFEIPGTSITNVNPSYTFRLDEYENLWDYYFECFKRLKPQVDVAFTLSGEGFGEELSPGLKAMREVLVNMLMHSDYFSPARSRIRIFTNHIEFYNPGGLPKPLEELKEKDISLPRNPVISKLFRMVRLAENAGFGFDKIDSNWQKYNNTAPEYDIAFDSTTVKLFTKTEKEAEKQSEVILDGQHELLKQLRNEFGPLAERLKKTPEENLAVLRGIYGVFARYLRGISEKALEKLEALGDKEVFILMLITIDESITAVDISKILGFSVITAKRSIEKLKLQGLVLRIGTSRSGSWKLTILAHE